MMESCGLKEFVITHALEEDVKEILAIDRECLDGLWSEVSYLEELANKNSEMLVLRSEGEILAVGCMWLYFEECHIIMLAVKPEYQNQGLGSILVWQMLDNAHRFGAEWVVLEVRVSNSKAINLYKQFGFKEVGRRKEYYSNNREDALVLWCKQVNTKEFKSKLDIKKEEILAKLNLRGWKQIKQPQRRKQCH